MQNKERIISKEIAKTASSTKNLDDHKLNVIKKNTAKKHKFKGILTNIKILTNLSNSEIKKYKNFLVTKPTRTISGVAVIAIMAKPFSCPHGKCIYCPGGVNSPFGTVPQSYTGREPATMRAIRNNYDPYLQIFNRLEQYIVIGQSPEKVELIIMGGTFPSFYKKYRDEFIYYCFKSMNDFSKEFYKTTKNGPELDVIKFKEFFELPGNIEDSERTKRVNKKILELKKKNVFSLEKEQEKNESSVIKCIGLTIETKPDWGKKDIGNELLEYGTTRIELGIQTPYDKVLKKINRGHSITDSIQAVRELKDLGFKLNFHLMPGLPGVAKQKDIQGLKKMFLDQSFRPDMVKVYPTMVFPGTKLFEDYKNKKFIPLTTEQSIEIIAEFKKIVPRYCRIMRLQRDIPSVLGKGVDRNNLRQYIENYTKKKNIVCSCIRCREIKNAKIKEPVEFEIIKYKASKGKEYFISLNDANDRLLGFVRLRIPFQQLRKEITEKTALIRELHVYGTAVSVGKKPSKHAQHKGFGSMLMQKAEDIARKEKKQKMVVISGIGVRGYYRKLGYEKQGAYMVKIIG